MDIYESLVKRIAAWMQLKVVNIPEKCYLETLRAPEWRLEVPNDMYTQGDEFIISAGPIIINHQYSFTSAKSLLNALLESSHISLDGAFVDESKNKGYLEIIHVKNPFYNISIDELKIKLDLMGA